MRHRIEYFGGPLDGGTCLWHSILGMPLPRRTVQVGGVKHEYWLRVRVQVEEDGSSSETPFYVWDQLRLDRRHP